MTAVVTMSRSGAEPTSVPSVDRSVFEERESQVRTYCRRFPAVFTRAHGHLLFDEAGRSWIDLLAGAGALNYGHNHPAILEPVIAYLQDHGVTHAMDLHTGAKREFLRSLTEVVLAPRGMPHRVQFCGPTGANAVEAALKLARRATGRRNVVAFTNAFHGMSLGALAATANAFKRAGAHAPLEGVTRLPYDGFLGPDVDTLAMARAMLTDPGSGIDSPAAIILECVQGEGGAHAASPSWLRGVATLARDLGALLVVDDIQAGCGRTGSFFSFDGVGIEPDLVCLSKSIGGLGFPLALVLVHPDVDTQPPGAHSGTFRGNSLAFVAGAAALDLWRDPGFAATVRRRATHLDESLRRLADRHGGQTRGRGLLRGITWPDPAVAERVSTLAFQRGVLAEPCGPRAEVLKLMPPLVIPDDALDDAFRVLDDVVGRCVRGSEEER